MGVEGWVGYQGEGKTYCAVRAALLAREKTGVAIWTNAEVVGAHRFQTWDRLTQLIEFALANPDHPSSRAILLLDEVGKFLPARFWNKMDPRVATLIQERRKVGGGVDLWWTAPAFSMVDKSLRDITAYVHRCKRLGGSEYSHGGGRPPLAFREQRWRMDDISTDSNRPKDKRKPVRKRLYHFSPDLASLYGSGILDMSEPLEGVIGERPDYYGPDDRHEELPATRIEVAPAPVTRRQRRKAARR